MTMRCDLRFTESTPSPHYGLGIILTLVAAKSSRWLFDETVNPRGEDEIGLRQSINAVGPN